LRSAADLVRAGFAAPEREAALARVAARYAVSITPALADLIDPADPADPIARQFIPTEAELVTRGNERADPIGDETHSPVPGLVHRYPDRVLLKPVQVCAVYCRFCFRREAVGPGEAQTLSPAALSRALDYIRATPAIWEVVVSGGDPLVLSPRRLREIVQSLAEIDHVKVLRVHTRLPVADPDAVTDDLADALVAPRIASWVVLHANHPRELTEGARRACARLVDRGLPMLSQSVLLRGVNDDPSTLEALMRGFVEARIKPYYLHHGDLAPGTSHLRTTIARGQELMRGLRGRVSGLCQPAFMLDIPAATASPRSAHATCATTGPERRSLRTGGDSSTATGTRASLSAGQPASRPRRAPERRSGPGTAPRPRVGWGRTANAGSRRTP
jgi:lysine 2,3-aminomutase